MTNTITHATPYSTLKPVVAEPITIFDEAIYSAEDYATGIVLEDIKDLTSNIVELIQRIEGDDLAPATRLLFVGSLATPYGITFGTFERDYIEFQTFQLIGKELRVSISGNNVLKFEYSHAWGVDSLSMYIVDSEEQVSSFDDIALLTRRKEAIQADNHLQELYGVAE